MHACWHVTSFVFFSFGLVVSSGRVFFFLFFRYYISSRHTRLHHDIFWPCDLFVNNASRRCMMDLVIQLFGSRFVICFWLFAMFIYCIPFWFWVGFVFINLVELRKYNVIVYPTDARGSTYIPALFRPTGWLHYLFKFYLLILSVRLSRSGELPFHYKRLPVLHVWIIMRTAREKIDDLVFDALLLTCRFTSILASFRTATNSTGERDYHRSFGRDFVVVELSTSW